MIKLSVIIPTRNRAKILERALVSISRQTLPKKEFELIVVDNGSTDITAEVCETLSSQFSHLIRLYDQHPGLHVGRNLGLEHAKADILVYGDDDIEAKPQWLESIAQAFERPEVALVGGKNLPIYEVPPPDWIERLWLPNASGERICSSLSILDLGNVQQNVSPYKVFGCNFSIRKSHLVAAGGFHPDGMPKELIRFRGDGETHVSRFVQRKGLVAFYHPGASVGHLVSCDRLMVGYFCWRAFIQGISDSFTDLREQGGRARLILRLQRVLKSLWLRTRVRFAFYPMYRMIAAAHSGYRFHQKEYHRDPTLRDWVHRANYWNGSGHIATQ